MERPRTTKWVLGGLIAAAAGLGGGASDELSLDELRLALQKGRYEAVERESRTLLEALEHDTETDPVQLARVLDLLVESLWRGGKSKGAGTLEFAEKAVQTREQAHGSDHPDLAISFDNLAHVLRTRGDYVRAEQHFLRALEIRERHLGRDHLDTAHSLNQLGWVSYSMGDYGRAETLYRRSLAIREQTLGRDHPEIAPTLNNLAILLKTLGDYSAAKKLYQRSLVICEKAYGESHSKVATALNNLAILTKNQGDYAAALPLYERAIQIGRATRGLDHPLVARSLGNLAALYKRMGDYGTAKRLQLQALEIMEKRLGPDHERVAVVLNNLGGLLADEGNTEQARVVLEKALRIREKALGADHRLVARVLGNLGELHVQSGELEAARVAFERALLIERESFDENHPAVAGFLERLADVLHRVGEQEAAKLLFEQALAIYETAFDPYHPKVATCLLALSSLLLDMGNDRPALELSLRADAIGREHLQLTARTLPERQALAYAAVRPEGQDLAFSVLVNGSTRTDTTTRVWDALIRSRSLVLDEMRARHAVFSHAGEPAQRFATASERLANLLVRGSLGASVEQYQRILQRARDEKERAERSLADASLDFRRHRESGKIGFSEVSSALPPRSTLVAYVYYKRRIGPFQVEPSYAALILRAGTSEPIVVPLGSADTIEPLIVAWQKEIRAARNTIPVLGRSGDLRYSRISERLRRAIWDPVAEHLGQANQVFVVPDGLLHIVQLDALATSEDQYLIETTPLIHYLTIERDLVPTGDLPVGQKGLFLVGSPEFDHAPSGARRNLASESPSLVPGSTPASDCHDFDDLSFAPLPGTSRELAAVASLWSSLAPEHERSHVTELLDVHASEEAFKRKAPGHRILHLATHAVVVNGRCLGLSSGLDVEGTIRSLGPSLDDRPMTFSGIALAGANNRHAAAGKGGDGILTALEISALDLSGVQWAVLSACDTGLGTLRPGEGVLGLRRAFEVAGVQTIIMSLWPVEDATARTWIQRLYRGRLAGMSSAEAVRNASLETLRTRRDNAESTHPFYWGAFVAVGKPEAN